LGKRRRQPRFAARRGRPSNSARRDEIADHLHAADRGDGPGKPPSDARSNLVSVRSEQSPRYVGVLMPIAALALLIWWMM